MAEPRPEQPARTIDPGQSFGTTQEEHDRLGPAHGKPQVSHGALSERGPTPLDEGFNSMTEMTANKELLAWVDEMAAMCQPDQIVWIDGSDEQRNKLRGEAVAKGEITELNQAKLPGCYLHRTAANDVARTEHLTYICGPSQEDVGPTNNWMSPEEGYRRAREIFKGSMRGRTMYVIPFSLGPIGSVFSKTGVELTDSIYVVLNMLIMVRCGKSVLDKMGPTGGFTKCLHGKAELDVNKRLILHFPEDNAIWSVGSGYGGNVLLGKKCMALRLASWPWAATRAGWPSTC
jgi:phosphoenolpyruvate carboxykinase (GTP)